MKPLPHQRHNGARRRPGWKQNNPNWAVAWRRLSVACVHAILMSRAPAKAVSAQLATQYGIACSPDMVRKIRAGKRRLDVSRTGTLYENPPAPRRYTPKRFSRRPDYLAKYASRSRSRSRSLARAPKLRPGYELAEAVA